jgi:hypothetical protein
MEGSGGQGDKVDLPEDLTCIGRRSRAHVGLRNL